MDAQNTMLEVVIGECKTIRDYNDLLEHSGCPACHAVLKELIRDEFKHVGAALHVITHNPEVAQWIEEGKQEAIEEIRKSEQPQPML